MSVYHQRLVSAGHAQLHVEGITRMIKLRLANWVRNADATRRGCMVTRVDIRG